MGVPRALYTDFPLGLSLGKPADETFQTQVIRSAFELLKETKGPIIRDFSISISATDSEPLQCALPARLNPDLHPAVDEAQALRAAYERAMESSKKTSVGMRIDAADIPDALAKFAQIAQGEHWETLGFSAASIYGTVYDIRSYYEELACELAEAPIAPWATEQWFYEQTEAGDVVLKARRAMRDQQVAQEVWFGLAPAGRE